MLRVHPRCRHRRPRARRRRGGPGCGGAARRTSVAARRRPGAGAQRAGRAGTCCCHAVRPPVGVDARARRHRHQRQDDHHLPARDDRAGRGRPRRCGRHRRCAGRGGAGHRIGHRIDAGAHTTPEASDLQALLARMRDARRGTVAMEVSSHALHQHRVDGVQFAAVCFTNLSHEHLDYHGTLDEYFEAKASLFTRARTGAAAVNVDDRAWRRARGARARATASTCGRYAVDDARPPTSAPTDVVFGAGVDAGHDRRPARGRRCGRRAVRSSGRSTWPTPSAAAATARAAGFPFDAVVAGLGAPRGRARPHGAGRRRPALRRAGRLRPHPRRPRPSAGRRPAPGRGHRAGRVRVRLRRRP